ncbi:MAG: AMP-binding protein [Myxococcota bacterium]|nr:AMP-binding protein [Myxococcota bacterium]
MAQRSTSPGLGALLQGALRRHAERVALVTAGRAWRYAELDERAGRLAGGLLGMGLRKGDRVALLLRNGAHYAIADLAIARVGLAKVPLNDLLSKGDVAYALEHSGASVALVHESLRPLVDDATGVRIVVVPEGAGDDGSFDHLCQGDTAACDPAASDEPAVIMYTGGTTGRPKGIVHTAGALGTNLLTHVLAGEIRFGERMLLSTPLPHSAGFFLQAGLLQGATVFVTPRFDPDELLREVEEQAISWTFMVPTMIYRLLDALRESPHDTSSLATIVYGAAPMAKARLHEALERLGPVFLQLFGQSECPNFATTLAKEDHRDPELLASCGRPVPGVEVRVADERGDCLAVGEVGEVLLRAPYTLLEYHRAPELTEQAYAGDWLRTGDVGFLTKTGHLFLVDRKKDMIITGGMNVYSSEVEQALSLHPSVATAAAVGVPDEDWGEAVHAFVVVRESAAADALIEFCRGRLARYKVPKGLTLVEALPTTPYGKVDKKALRRDWLRHRGGES